MTTKKTPAEIIEGVDLNYDLLQVLGYFVFQREITPENKKT